MCITVHNQDSVDHLRRVVIYYQLTATVWLPVRAANLALPAAGPALPAAGPAVIVAVIAATVGTTRHWRQ